MSLRNGLAVTPPMGWNSFDCYGTTVQEDEVKANALYMATHLKSYGWEYIIVDILWYEADARTGGYRPEAVLNIDGYSRVIPDPKRFPSSQDGQGFKPLADYIHALGLKFGIHIMRGIPRQAVRANSPVFGSKYRAAEIADQESICPWNADMFGLDMRKPGAQAYYDSIIALYASWEIDFLKADDINWPYREAEITAIASAIEKSRRSIVLSLSPGSAQSEPDRIDHLQNHCELSRISDDFWDRWIDLKNQFELCHRWSAYQVKGYWPDADMLPLGRIDIRGERGPDRQSRFSRDEQYTLMTLWSISRSPLMMGGNLPDLDDFTLALLTNEEVLTINQKSTWSHQFSRQQDKVVWVADAPVGGEKYLALFNLSDFEPATFEIDPADILGTDIKNGIRVRNLWHRQDLEGVEKSFISTLQPHACALYSLNAAK
jgi:alpha-galactosidase